MIGLYLCNTCGNSFNYSPHICVDAPQPISASHRECTTHHHACDCREALFSEIKSRIDILESKQSQHKSMLLETMRIRDEALAKLAIAREALGFYSNQLHYEMAFRKDINHYVPANSEGTSVIESDHGKIAREALKKMVE